MPPAEKDTPNDRPKSESEQCRLGDSPPAGDDDFLYLYIPPGRYQMPPETLPMDLNVLERAIPDSEIRSMSQAEYRQMIELQKQQNETS
jgi:hypothetical protein